MRVRYRRFLASIMVASALVGCNRKPITIPTPPAVVEVQTPREGSVTDYEYFTGRTEAPESIDVRARVTGYITKIGFEPGGDVKKGQLLFEIDPRPYKAQYDLSVGQLAVDNAQLKLAIAEYNIGKEVAKTPGAISQQELEKRAAAVARAQAAVQATTAQVEYNKIMLDFCQVTSPIDGVVSRYYFSQGNLVNQDNTLLTTVVSQDPMWCYFSVDERTMLRVQQLMREGKIRHGVVAKAPINIGLANEGDRFPHVGVFDFVNNQVEKSTGTITIRGSFPNPAPAKGGPRFLKPGLFVRVQLPIGPPHQAMQVPEEAVGIDQGKKYLFVVNEKDVIEYRPVELGALQPDGWRVIVPQKVIRDGDSLRPVRQGETGQDSLLPGDRVVVSGLQRVRPGMKVEIKTTEAKKQ